METTLGILYETQFLEKNGLDIAYFHAPKPFEARILPPQHEILLQATY